MTKQSSFLIWAKMDCFASARNDGEQARGIVSAVFIPPVIARSIFATKQSSFQPDGES